MMVKLYICNKCGKEMQEEEIKRNMKVKVMGIKIPITVYEIKYGCDCDGKKNDSCKYKL